MSEKIEYKIVHHYDLDTRICVAGLEQKVNELAKEGWRTAGGVTKDSEGMYQAMFKTIVRSKPMDGAMR